MPGIVQHPASMHGPRVVCVFQNGRLYCVQMLRVLLRARVGGFQAWGVEYLVLQLYDATAAVRMEALAAARAASARSTVARSETHTVRACIRAVQCLACTRTYQLVNALPQSYILLHCA